MTYGQGYFEQRHTTMNQITPANVKQLSLAWSFELGEGGGKQEGTPLFANGIIYAQTNWSIVVAIDARTQKEIWRYDPMADRTTRMCCGVLSRGIALYEGKVLVPVNDGRIEAIDMATGKLIWSSWATPKREPGKTSPYAITMAPRVGKGKVFIGNAGADFPPFRGYVSAFDTDNGKELWRFYTVPGDPSKGFENKAMEAAAKTWTGEWWKYGGGGSMWDGMAYDPDENLVYVGTGNGLPWPQDLRQGKGTPHLDNLYIASIIAIDADSGQLKWHYSCTPGDQWDYDAIQHLLLADLRINNRNRKVIMQANKNGYFYVIDRVTGEFISAGEMSQISWARGMDPRAVRSSMKKPIIPRAGRHRLSRSDAQRIADVLQSRHRIDLRSHRSFEHVYLHRGRKHGDRSRPVHLRRRSSRGAAGPAGALRADKTWSRWQPCARWNSHSLGSRDSEGTVVRPRRRSNRRRRADNRIESCDSNHTAREIARVYRRQRRTASGYRAPSDLRRRSADDLSARWQAIHRGDGRHGKHGRSRRGGGGGGGGGNRGNRGGNGGAGQPQEPTAAAANAANNIPPVPARQAVRLKLHRRRRPNPDSLSMHLAPQAHNVDPARRGKKNLIAGQASEQLE
jgi:outer membrane protein assembly factor BamB